MLEDINDNAPVFINSSYSVIIAEANITSAYDILQVSFPLS